MTLLLLLMSCGPKPKDDAFVDPCDRDDDGHAPLECGGLDCDDLDSTRHPGRTEVWYDGVDQDCDRWSDYDQDRDGSDSADFGGQDCDDLDYYAGPAAIELCGDGRDNDCDAQVDESNCARTFDDAIGVWGDEDMGMIGTDIATDCDLDGDGELEVLVSAPMVWFESGTWSTVKGVRTASEGDDLFPADGFTLSREVYYWGGFAGGLDCHGDNNDDGHPDLGLTNGDNWVDGVYVLYGPMYGSLEIDAADVSIAQFADPWELDTGLALRVGDVTGDRQSDLVFGMSDGFVGGGIGGGAFLPTSIDGAAIVRGPIGAGEHDVWDSMIYLPGAKLELLTVADIDGDGVDDILLADDEPSDGGVRCAQAYSGLDLAAVEPGTFVDRDLATFGFDCEVETYIDPRVVQSERFSVVHLAMAPDLDNDGHLDVFVGHRNGWSAYQGGGWVDGAVVQPDAKMFAEFCYSWSGVVDAAFDQSDGGPLTWATALGGPPDCPEHNNVFLGRVALTLGWDWVDRDLMDADAWIAWGPDSHEISSPGSRFALPVRLGFSHEATEQTRLWVASPLWNSWTHYRWGYDEQADDLPALPPLDGPFRGWLAAFDLADLVPPP